MDHGKPGIFSFNFKYIAINAGRVVMLLVAGLMLSGQPGLRVAVFALVGASLIYLILESLFDLTAKWKPLPYFATGFDILGTLFYGYISGLNSLYLGAFLYITAVCSTVTATKQAEFSLWFASAVHAAAIALVLTGALPYMDVFDGTAYPNVVALVSTWFLVSLVNIFNYRIIRGLVQRNYTLLTNILPRQVVDAIERSGNYPARRYEDATVVFTDFVSFTAKTRDLPPDRVVAVLDRYFSAFDAIIAKHGLEKLKTIGDGYMFASGVPVPEPRHLERALRACLDIVATVDELKRPGEPNFDIRVGLATGPITAAIIGKEKFSYDVWGTTVNLASRLEAGAEPGSICVSGEVAKRARGAFSFGPSGVRDFKGLGTVETYRLEPRSAGEAASAT